MAGRLRVGDPGYEEVEAARDAVADASWFFQRGGGLAYLTQGENSEIHKQLALVFEFLREFDLLFAGWVIGRKSDV
jgi:hypothetical protein